MPAGKKTPREINLGKMSKSSGKYEPDWLPDWLIVTLSLQNGEDPPRPELANDLRGDQPVPREVRDFLAAQIEAGRLKRQGKGAPPHENIMEREVSANYLQAEYDFQLEIAHWKKECGEDLSDTPSIIAMEWAANAWAVSEGYKLPLPEALHATFVERIRKKITIARQRLNATPPKSGGTK